ncbi:hypothetical protein LZG04_02785 [Saccharothrix sp. S26]|uniref:hypothetical protein n=1 Tax=Saccharothrix sp. S26 TaxID=2907215 RepID=UPI001F3D13A6|nr:hypothetical protein [Saccharothrix sp. S26]MCE6993738.1 hypothetical protein [Saccharothrix sp. S26]
MIALVGGLVGLRAGYRYDRSIGRRPWWPGVKRLAFWALLFVAEWLLVPRAATALGPVVVVAVYAYVMAVGLSGPWVSEYYRRRAT